MCNSLAKRGILKKNKQNCQKSVQNFTADGFLVVVLVAKLPYSVASSQETCYSIRLLNHVVVIELHVSIFQLILFKCLFEALRQNAACLSVFQGGGVT